MKKFLIFISIIFLIIGCGNQKKEIKEDLAKLRISLEQVNNDFRTVLGEAEKIIQKEEEATSMFRNPNETEAEKKIKEQEKDKRKQEYKKEISELKFPDVKQSKELIQKLEKNLSKVKSKNETETGYYYTTKNVLDEAKSKVEGIENLKERVSNVESKLGILQISTTLFLDNVIQMMSQLENYPI